MKRFYIDPSNCDGKISVISGSDAKHITRVLRLKKNDIIGIFDGKGHEFEAKIITTGNKEVKVSISRILPAFCDSPVKITVAQAFLKDKKMDKLVKHLTELGINSWIPFSASRCVPDPGYNRLCTRKQKWKKIALEAVKQCNRSTITEICDAVTFDEAVKIGNKHDQKIIFWEKELKPLHTLITRSNNKNFSNFFIMIGPEGGFTGDEIEMAVNSDFITVSIGPRILRAETATITACSLVQYLFGDIGLERKKLI